MIADEVITAVTVCWKYVDVIERSLTSMRKFHPSMRIIVVDGSTPDMPCYQYLDSLNDINTEVYHVGYNIGHGKGMNYGIDRVKNPFVLIFDSDIEMVLSPVQDMLNMMKDDTFGVGYIEMVAPDGHDYGVFPRHKAVRPLKYMHPYFQLIQLKEYKKYKPFIHHGAPCITTMLDIHRRGLSDRVLKEFPDLGHTSGCGVSWRPCAGKYIRHDVGGFGGTGRMRLKEGLPHIEGAWERVV